MEAAPIDDLLARARPGSHAHVRALAAAVESSGLQLEQRFTYQMLVYTLDGRWKDWIVAIGVSKAAVNLRFLHGDRLDDPAGLLRPGSSTLMTIDYAAADDIDADLVRRYVSEAVEKRPR